ncbi:hypothetical protein M0811_13454 [Anaeramoeba ignava]|uniref:RRM domain-containing protein n=1 Tax=Anaeramoeba ignava TaxID=1746090 RepID=A0A9Q0R5B5_ANAIG|nr:hypothetical protein M0811_13454 [Anaeramoeba ignava]
MPINERKNDPLFINYNPGIPNNILYVKNIHKKVKKQDLFCIFARYLSKEENEEQLKIKLFKFGKMRGQAFITYNSILSAKKALEETNGFIFFSKPIIVLFAKKE